MRLSIILNGSFLFLVGCATTSVVRVQSFPEGAEVALVSKEGGVRPIGKTPLMVPPQSLEDGRLNSFIITKDGFKDHHILLGRDKTQENYDISVNLQAQSDDPKVLDSRARQERLAKLVLQGHNLTSSKRYSEAERVLETVILDYPHISAGFDLLGNLAYLKKDLKMALKHYERSLQINPENSETRAMVERIKAITQ